jgi:uncharacterized protein YpiB (UPF0302 family)
VFNIGIIVTLFIALIQIFDPTLDEHIHAIQDRNQQQPSFVLNFDDNHNNHPFASILAKNKNKNHRRQQLRKKHAFDQMNRQNRHHHVTNNQNLLVNSDRVLQLLDEAGFDLNTFNTTQLDHLPKWKEVSQME